MLEAATDLVVEYLEAVMGKGGEYFGIQNSLQPNSRYTYSGAFSSV